MTQTQIQIQLHLDTGTFQYEVPLLKCEEGIHYLSIHLIGSIMANGTRFHPIQGSGRWSNVIESRKSKFVRK